MCLNKISLFNSTYSEGITVTCSGIVSIENALKSTVYTKVNCKQCYFSLKTYTNKYSDARTHTYTHTHTHAHTHTCTHMHTQTHTHVQIYISASANAVSAEFDE